MLILLPPSETKRPGGRGTAFDLDALALPQLRAQRSALIDALVALSGDEDEAARVLKLSERQRGEIAVNAALRESPTLPAVDRYTGVLYDALGAGTLDATSRRWLGTHVLIHSAPFGPVGALDRIPAYRLSSGAVLPGVPPLRRHWADAEIGRAACGERVCQYGKNIRDWSSDVCSSDLPSTQPCGRVRPCRPSIDTPACSTTRSGPGRWMRRPAGGSGHMCSSTRRRSARWEPWTGSPPTACPPVRCCRVFHRCAATGRMRRSDGRRVGKGCVSTGRTFVTGVQTCALPICRQRSPAGESDPAGRRSIHRRALRRARGRDVGCDVPPVARDTCAHPLGAVRPGGSPGPDPRLPPVRRCGAAGCSTAAPPLGGCGDRTGGVWGKGVSVREEHS